jgi:hypothetical protein
MAYNKKPNKPTYSMTYIYIRLLLLLGPGVVGVWAFVPTLCASASAASSSGC